MSAVPHEPLTQSEFPPWEQTQLAKHEFANGHVYGFAGGTVRHNRLAALLIEKIAPVARPCATYGSDMLVEMPTSTRYADVVVTCDERDGAGDCLTIRYPKLIIEVLSESTAGQELGVKMREYLAIPSLEEYAVIDSRRRWAQVARRHEAGWVLEPPVSAGSMELRCIPTAVDLDDLYGIAAID